MGVGIMNIAANHLDVHD